MIFALPELSKRGVYATIYRNILNFKHGISGFLFWGILEPLVVLFALGLGIGAMMRPGESYLTFLLPGFLVNLSIFVGFGSTVYRALSRLENNGYEDAIRSGVARDAIFLGEIVWSTSLACFSGFVLAVVGLVSGLYPLASFPLVVLTILFSSMVGALIGILSATFCRSVEDIHFISSGILVPVSCICGAYYPIEIYPRFWQFATGLFPHKHATEAMRLAMSGQVQASIFLDFAFLILMAFLLTGFATAKFQNKIPE